jgi:hypothetical protein
MIVLYPTLYDGRAKTRMARYRTKSYRIRRQLAWLKKISQQPIYLIGDNDVSPTTSKTLADCTFVPQFENLPTAATALFLGYGIRDLILPPLQDSCVLTYYLNKQTTIAGFYLAGNALTQFLTNFDIIALNSLPTVQLDPPVRSQKQQTLTAKLRDTVRLCPAWPAEQLADYLQEPVQLIRNRLVNIRRQQRGNENKTPKHRQISDALAVNPQLTVTELMEMFHASRSTVAAGMKSAGLTRPRECKKQIIRAMKNMNDDLRPRDFHKMGYSRTTTSRAFREIRKDTNEKIKNAA